MGVGGLTAAVAVVLFVFMLIWADETGWGEPVAACGVVAWVVACVLLATGALP